MEWTITHVDIRDDHLHVHVSDGRHVSAPLSTFPRLVAADKLERVAWIPCAAGQGIRWPLIDEDLSVEQLLEDARL